MLTKASWKNKYMDESNMQNINKILLARAWFGVWIIDIVWCVQNIKWENEESQTDQTDETEMVKPGHSDSEIHELEYDKQSF